MRSFDVATFVAFGAAQLGVAGNDVLMEFDYSEIYAPLDLDIGHCRMAVAEPAEWAGHEDPRQLEPCPRRHQISRGHAPPLRRARRAGRMHQAERRDGAGAAARRSAATSSISCRPARTLRANGLVEIEHIADITSRLIVNRAGAQDPAGEVGRWIERFRAATERPGRLPRLVR